MVIDPNSAAISAELARRARPGGSAAGYQAWASYDDPFYTVPVDQPLVPVAITTGNPPGFQAAINANGGVPIPPTAVPRHTSDGWLAIYQPSLNKYWEFYQASPDGSGGWTAHYGGCTDRYSTLRALSQTSNLYPNMPPCFAPGCWGGDMSSAKWAWGPSSAKTPLLPMAVTSTEFANALAVVTAGGDSTSQIAHTIGLWIDLARPGEWSYPAQDTDGNDTTNAVTIPYGAWFKFPAEFDPATITNLRARVLAYTVKKYGLMCHDVTHANLEISFARAMPGEPLWSVNVPNTMTMMSAFPWESLVLMPLNLRSTPGPQ